MVRSWWLTAAVLAIMSIWLITQQFLVNREASYRIQHWTRTTARINKINGSSRTTYRVEPDVLATGESELTYTDKQGVQHTVTGHLNGQIEARDPSDVIPLLYNPADSGEWTDRTALPSLAERMMISIILIPLAVILALVAWWQRRRLLQLWETGTAVQAKVVHLQQSATSPRSSLLRCAVANRADSRLLAVTVPHRSAILHKDDTIDLIVDANGKALAIATMLYQ